MSNVKNSWTPNEVQTKFLEVLKGANEPMTLAEISEKVGYTIKTGSINTLITKGLVVSEKGAKEIVCACCGHKTKVSTYKLA